MILVLKEYKAVCNYCKTEIIAKSKADLYSLMGHRSWVHTPLKNAELCGECFKKLQEENLLQDYYSKLLFDKEDADDYSSS